MDSSIVPTFILQSDGLLGEGLRLMLSRTRFRPQHCEVELDDLAAIPSDRPILFIVEIRQKQESICKKIRARYPSSSIVAIGDESNHRCLTGALDDGANAVLFNSVTANALVNSLHTVMSGELIVIDARFRSLEIQTKTEEEIQTKAEERTSPPIQNAAPWETKNEPNDVKQFSAREIAILERIVRGESNKHVARFFSIAEPTVKAHVKAILRKIGASNRTQAAIWALNHRLFDAPSGAPHDFSVLLQHEASRETQLRSDPPSAFEMNGVPTSGRYGAIRLP
jgi:two-component system, NarL family, nitrate/nitrite response regulator NarL